MTTPPPPGDPRGRDDSADDVSPEDSPSLTAPAPPPGVLDAARAAAMAAFDDAHGGRDDATPSAPVGDLAAARARRWYQRVPLGAVAAVIAAIAVVGTLTQIDTGGDDDLATAVADDSAELDTSGDLGGDASSGGAADAPVAGFEADESYADDGARTEEGAATLDAAASYEDLDAFLAVVAGQDPTVVAESPPPQPSTTTQSGSTGSGDDSADGDGSAPCDAVATADVDGVVAVEVAFVEDLGVLVAAVVYESETGARVTAVDLSSCDVLEDRAL